jgi:hypothetical protein
LVVRLDVVLGLDFTVHAGVYSKVPFLPQESMVVVVVVVVLHDPSPSQYEAEARLMAKKG